MVPLKPNELSRPSECPGRLPRPVASDGIRRAPRLRPRQLKSDMTCAFNLWRASSLRPTAIPPLSSFALEEDDFRSYAFTPTTPASSGAESNAASPAAAAHASRWPMFALSDAHYT